MKKIHYILILLVTVLQISCQEDPWEEIEEGGWNNERSIIDIKFENQVGQPQITRLDEQSGVIDITINVGAIPDLSSVKISSLQTSYKAESSATVGDALNFENESKSSTITVTSPTGLSRDYTVKVTPFTESLIGTYDITNLILYGGTGPEYGGGGVLPLTDKPWVWPENGGPAAELDNTLVFEMTGITEEGNTYGTVINNAGEDGAYANFVYVLDPETDVNHFYRKIPKGEGEWLRNYAAGTITFTFPDGSTTTGSLVGAGTEELGNGLAKTTTDMAFAFNLNGTDDWDKIYSDYDKFVKKPRRFWIDVTKQQ